jgi:hypothetical protein
VGSDSKYLLTIFGPVQQKKEPVDQKNLDFTDFEDEAGDQDNSSLTEKTVDLIFCTNKEWIDHYVVFKKFVQYNLHERVQFHPEFSTPPPKIANI